MSDQPEVILQQMEETRSDLAQKVRTLEQQVVDTVAEANTAVAETVENVKETVENVKDAFQETVDTVKEKVEETVESVKNAFDLSQQWDRHPWALMGGAVALGYLGGYLLGTTRTSSSRGERRAGSYVPSSSRAEGVVNGSASNGAASKQPSRPGWLDTLREHFGTEIDKVKALAIGTSLGLVRDLLVEAAPETLRSSLADMVNSFTTKLGGEPIEGPVLPPSPGDPQEAAHAQGNRGERFSEYPRTPTLS